MFTRKYVIQQEELHAFCNRTEMHHNKENSNTSFERTNNKIKHSVSSTHQQMIMSYAM